MDFFPNPEDLTQGINTAQREGAARWEEMLPVRDRVLKALDAARDDKVIGAPLEAAVSLNANGDLLKLLKSVENELPTWFITSEVSLEQGTTDELEVKVDRARGDKCERCWRYTTDVGSNGDFPTVCARCASVLPDFLG
jgi:isoleucyl-tRNA synthetase